MSRTGIIELHGGKLVISIPGPEGPTIIQIVSSHFMPGDKVILDKEENVKLLERKQQAVIGVVKAIQNQIASLYIAHLGPSCHFQPDFQITADLQRLAVGDRLVLWLESNGEISFRALFSGHALDDVPCLLKMYSLYKKPEDFIYLLNDYGKPLYTIEKTVNHNELNTFTIDPSSSEDLDDAISVDPNENTVYVHIVDIAAADCNHIISEQARRRLRERCQTLYMANEHTEHLLDPDVASYTLSLIKGEQRNVITVKVVLNDNGIVQTYDIYRSTIIVKHRYNYDEVKEILMSAGSLRTHKELIYLARLAENRSSNVKYNINLPSMRFNVDKTTGHIMHDQLKVESTNDDSHNVVATAMVLANLVVSKHLMYSQVKLPNRFHEVLHGMSSPSFTSTGNEMVDSFIMVKRYARACYSVDKKGHFGLGLTDYVHFTSPMRRYADVLVHQILAGAQFNNEALMEEVAWLNFRAQVVRSIQDMYTHWKVIRYVMMEPKVYEVWITDVKKGGVLWFIPSLSLNGFAHVSTLSPKQFWYFDYSKNTLEGQQNKSLIAIGKKFQATVDGVDMITYSPNLTIHC
jgi:exoribonuclease R